MRKINAGIAAGAAVLLSIVWLRVAPDEPPSDTEVAQDEDVPADQQYNVRDDDVGNADNDDEYFGEGNQMWAVRPRVAFTANFAFTSNFPSVLTRAVCTSVASQEWCEVLSRVGRQRA